MLDACKDKFGNVDTVINAGIHSALPMGFSKMTEGAWETGIALNLDAHFHLIHKFLPHFLVRVQHPWILEADSCGLGKRFRKFHPLHHNRVFSGSRAWKPEACICCW